ncbi:PAS domain-containing protein [Ideonella sp.]|uniref:PAS domain-containing hybrid sensor histidine kinase/response regulator n=1 Tax=Ideonella sp. TaxID=1929293 RepID=UPI0035B4EE09
MTATPQDPSFDLDQLHMALDMSNVSIWRLDVSTQRVHANTAGFRLLGLPPRPEGWPVDDMMLSIHPDDRAVMIEAAHQARQQGKQVEAVARFKHEDGQWRQVLTRRMAIRGDDGQLLAFVGMAIDVTARMAAEQRLRDANQQIALIARTAGIGTWEWDLPEGTSRWDEQMFLLRGLTPGPQSPTIAEMTQLLHPDDRDYVSQQIQRAMGGRGATQYEFRVMLPDGQVRWLASRSVPVFDDQGVIIRRIGVNWDITASREAEAQRQAKAVAERESEAKSELLARMSHELRTPLNAILGFTELMLADDQRQGTGARLARLEHIQSAGRHLLALINDVLELARPGSEAANTHPLSRVPLEELFADTLPLVEGAAQERGVTLRRDPCAPGLAAMADALWLKQVLLNLLTNAVKYNRPGGWVDLSARAVSPGRVCITVRDGGHGMSAEALERAFEPFHRAAERQPGVPGVGIGLAVVKTLMARMGGEVTARSTPGQGSEFELWLGRADDEAAAGHAGFTLVEQLPAPPMPAAALPAPAPAPTSTPAALPAAPPAPAPEAAPAGTLPPGATPVLLYIEDNPVNVMIVQELAERRPGLVFHSAPDGGSGLRKAAELAPSLILLDMQLPDLHGLEVMAQLRKDPRTLRIPCIALSANAMPEDIRHALQSGFADYWTKPLDFGIFNQAMDALFQSTAG